MSDSSVQQSSTVSSGSAASAQGSAATRPNDNIKLQITPAEYPAVTRSEGRTDKPRILKASDAPAAKEEVPRETLLDIATKRQEQNADVKWWWDENTPGQGEKPDWLNDKTFKNALEQAKAQNEARKQLGAFDGAPKDGQYEFSLAEDHPFPADRINMEHPLMEQFTKMAVESNMSNEMFNQILNEHYRALADYDNQPSPAMEQKMQSLYAEKEAQMEEYAPQLLDELEKEFIQEESAKFSKEDLVKSKETFNWIADILGEDKAKMLKENLTSYDVQMALAELKSKSGARPVPKFEDDGKPSEDIGDMLRQKRADPRFQTDYKYRQALHEEYKKYYGNR